MIKTLLSTIAIVTFFISYSQQSYPLEVLPGKTIQLKSGADTLWVINNSQMQKSIKDEMILVKADSMFRIFQAEINTYQKVITKKTEINKKANDSYKHYLDLWKDCDAKLEAEEKKVIKIQNRNKVWTGVGFVSGVLLTTIVTLLL